MDFADIIASSIGYVALAFLPPICWLLIYLREDRHPEPKHLIALTFIGGIGSALVALAAERALLFGLDPEKQFIIFFAAIALIEEYVKYLSVKLTALHRLDFNEPIDAMIYMVTAGLGFAAIENVLFLFIQVYDAKLLLGVNLLAGVQLSAARFISANLLHALASAIVGYFLARAWFHPLRKHLIAIGIVCAAILHVTFDYLIMNKDILPGGTAYIAALLGLALVFVLIDFHKLKKENP